MIAALAGRRPDNIDAARTQFPIENAMLVRERLRAMMIKHKLKVLVCSAACGADLLALDVAGDLEIKRWVILPFAPDDFRNISVVDRPGHWGLLYDRIIKEVDEAGRLVVLDEIPGNEAAFATTNEEILRSTERIAEGRGDDVSMPIKNAAMVIAVWEKQPRKTGDATLELIRKASVRGFQCVQVSTLASEGNFAV